MINSWRCLNHLRPVYTGIHKYKWVTKNMLLRICLIVENESKLFLAARCIKLICELVKDWFHKHSEQNPKEWSSYTLKWTHQSLLPCPPMDTPKASVVVKKHKLTCLIELLQPLFDNSCLAADTPSVQSLSMIAKVAVSLCQLMTWRKIVIYLSCGLSISWISEFRQEGTLISWDQRCNGPCKGMCCCGFGNWRIAVPLHTKMMPKKLTGPAAEEHCI